MASYLYLFVKSGQATHVKHYGDLKETHDIGPDLMEYLVFL